MVIRNEGSGLAECNSAISAISEPVAVPFFGANPEKPIAPSATVSDSGVSTDTEPIAAAFASCSGRPLALIR